MWSYGIDAGENFTFINNGGVRWPQGVGYGCGLGCWHHVNLSGNALQLTTGTGNQQDGTIIINRSYREGGQRPDQVFPNPYVPGRNKNYQWLKSQYFCAPRVGTYGNFGVRNIVSPGTIQINIDHAIVSSSREPLDRISGRSIQPAQPHESGKSCHYTKRF